MIVKIVALLVLTGPVVTCKTCHHTYYPRENRLSETQMMNVIQVSAKEIGWKLPKPDLEAMRRIAWKESRYNTRMSARAEGLHSSSAGLYGFLNDTRKHYGGHGVCPYCQTIAAFKYVKARYGTPQHALYIHNKQGNY